MLIAVACIMLIRVLCVFRLVVCGLTASHFQLASGDEPGMLDIAGFDATVPAVIHSFVTGSL